MNHKKILLLLALTSTLFFSACANKSVIKSSLEDDVKDNFLTKSKNLSAASPTDSWWLEFNDSLLNKLVAFGLENNKDVQIANAGISTARELNNIDISALAPSASINFGRQRFSSPGFGPKGAKYDLYQSNFDVVWELDLFGKNLDRAKAGKLRFLKEIQLYKALALRVSSEIAKNYIELGATQKQLLNLHQILETREKLIKIAEQKEKNGTAPKTDIHNAQINLSAVFTQLSELETSGKIITYRLAVLTGKTPDQINEILKNSDPKKIINYQSGVVPTGLKSDILRRRPDIVAAEYELEASVFDKSAQFKEFFPSFNLTSKIGGGATDIGEVFKNGSNIKDIKGFVSLPIFEGGRLLAEYKISKTKSKIAILQYENTILKALEECESELLRYVSAVQIESAVNQQLKSSVKIFAINKNKKRYGVISDEELLNAKIAMLNMENQLITRKLQTLTNLISFHKAIGGGFEGYKINFKKDRVFFTKENENK